MFCVVRTTFLTKLFGIDKKQYCMITEEMFVVLYVTKWKNARYISERVSHRNPNPYNSLRHSFKTIK